MSQVRDGANALVAALPFDLETRILCLARVAANLRYTQIRNQQARRSHIKTRRRRLRTMGLFTSQMPCCIPPYG